ncbi:MAG: hypothetical protein O6766_13980 [Gammaproteobacteria bacterium]|nr:hypothetical protein [Gammaproteobacteria bacterium]
MADRPTTPSISASPDDAAGYRRTGRRRSSGGDSGPRMIGINLILAVLVAGLVMAGWFIANQHQMLTKEAQDMATAQNRIAVLEDRLRITDEEMTNTGQNTREQIGFWETEIRKLWTIANERNRKWIKDNEAGLKKQAQTLASVQASNTEMNASVGRHESAFRQQQEIIDQLTSVELQLQQIHSAQRDLVDKANAAQQIVASLQAGLVNRVSDNEQAVASMDGYRVTLNSRLSRMERRLDTLANPTL